MMKEENSMKYITLIIVTLLFINCKEITKAQSSESVVKTTEVETIMNFLASDELEGRDTGSEGLKKAAKYIEKIFKDAGLGVSPFFDSYLPTFDAKGKQTYNVVGYLKGTDPDLANEFVIIGAHFDHIGKGKEVNGDTIANGANDNAAGSTAVISLAKHFAKAKGNKRSILFVLFGAEEIGLLGSKHLAKVLKAKKLELYTMINFEMIGVPLVNKSYKAYITGYEMSNMAEKMNEYAGEKLIGFLPKAKQFQLFRRSDNFPFYKEFNVPCQTICTFDFSNYDYYHHVDDEVSNIDINFMTELINDCIPVITSISNSETQEIKLK